MDEECESVTEAKSSPSVKKCRFTVLEAMAKYSLKKQQEREQGVKGVGQKGANKAAYMQNGDKVTAVTAESETNKEALVGITEFIKEGDGFFAILKQRYSDFHVNEISVQGNVIHLTDQSLPVEPSSLMDEETFLAVLTAEEWSGIDSVMKSEESEKATFELDVTPKTKAERNAIHKALKFKYGKCLASNSEPQDGKTIMKIFKHTTSHGSWRRPPMPAPYLQFVMYKENLSSMEAIQSIARRTQYGFY